MAGADCARLRAVARGQAVREEEAQQRIVGLVPMAEDLAARDDRRARAQHGALHRHVLEPRRPALERRVPGPGKPLRPRPRAEFIERLEALPDPLGRQFDDAGRGERGDKSSLGWLARNRPEQVLHKVMNGFPGTDMLAMRFLPDQQVSDLMAYIQTLDSKQK